MGNIVVVKYPVDLFIRLTKLKIMDIMVDGAIVRDHASKAHEAVNNF